MCCGNRIESSQGLRQLAYMEQLRMGTGRFVLITV
jgi:hypothetical protein